MWIPALPSFTNIEEGRAYYTIFAFHKEVAKGCFIILFSIVNKKKLYIPLGQTKNERI